MARCGAVGASAGLPRDAWMRSRRAGCSIPASARAPTSRGRSRRARPPAWPGRAALSGHLPAAAGGGAGARDRPGASPHALAPRHGGGAGGGGRAGLLHRTWACREAATRHGSAMRCWRARTSGLLPSLRDALRRAAGRDAGDARGGFSAGHRPASPAAGADGLAGAALRPSSPADGCAGRRLAKRGPGCDAARAARTGPVAAEARALASGPP